jgi:hypothetical protein
MTISLAERILAVRQQQGYFRTIDELALIDGMTPALLERFHTMRANMEQELSAKQQEKPDRQASESAFEQWFFNNRWLLFMGSYGVAALFQIGRLLFLSALLYSGIVWLARLTWRSKETPVSQSPRRIRRMMHLFSRGLGVALLAFLCSLWVFGTDLTMSLQNMVLAGGLIWGVVTLLRALRRRSILHDKVLLGWHLAAWLAAFLATGIMY